MLILLRSPSVTPTSRGQVRRLAFITSKGVLAGIENAADRDQLPEGDYELIMATMRSAQMEALWLKDTKLFIHPANFADQLEGCAAPGYYSADGVNLSRDSMNLIFESLGGFREGESVPFRCVTLNVSDNMNLTPMFTS